MLETKLLNKEKICLKYLVSDFTRTLSFERAKHILEDILCKVVTLNPDDKDIQEKYIENLRK